MWNNYLQVQKSDTPFEYFIIDNALNDEFFKEVRKQYYVLIDRIKEWEEEYGIQFVDGRKLEHGIQISHGTKNESSYDEILKLSNDLPELKTFIQELQLKATYKDFFTLSRPIKIFKPNQKISPFDFLFYTCCRLSIKISRCRPGSGIAIHKDNPVKIVSMLYYMGWSDGENRDGGGTQIYKWNGNSKEAMDHGHFTNPKFELISDVSPVPNRIMGFIRSNKSWHGVLPVTPDLIGKAITRDVLQINLVHHYNYGKTLAFFAKLRKIIRNRSFNV